MQIKNLVGLLWSALDETSDERERDAVIALVFRYLAGWNRADLKLRMEEEAPPGLAEKIGIIRDQLRTFMPIQYIIGTTTFREMELVVGPSALIPRPETEELVGRIIMENRQWELREFSFLDIGTGSGCIALALKKAFPYASAEAVDISEEALNLARTNAERNRMQVNFRKLDILDPSETEVLPGFHLIVCNPPYVTGSEKSTMSPSVLNYEPHLALFVPDDDPLLFYRAIGTLAFRILIRPGTLYAEINEHFGKEVKELFLRSGFDRVEVIKDLQGKDRFVRAEAKHTMADTSYWMADKQQP